MTMAYIAAAVAAIGAGLTTYGEASAAQAQAGYQAQIAANNEIIAKQQRTDALNRGELEAQKAMQEQAQLFGQQRAALAASGVEVTQGSALDILASTRFLGKQDVATIQSNAAREAWGYSISAANYAAETTLQRWRENQASPALQGALVAGTSLLSSASTYLSKNKTSTSSTSSGFQGNGPLLSYQNK